MALQPNRFGLGARTGVGVGVAVDEGLRAYMLKVYNYMASALLLSGVVAYTVAHVPALFNAIFGTPLQWVVIFAPLVMVIVFYAKIQKMSLTAAQTVFWAFATMMGASLATIFVIYTQTSIVRVFLITAITFGAMSLYGYTTKRDLTGMGSFLIMGLFGIIIASIVNMFIESTMLHWVISVIGVLVFVGLTAYDTQRIKEVYYAGDSAAVMGKKAIMGALSLYLDFLNLFLMLLRIFGGRN